MGDLIYNKIKRLKEMSTFLLALSLTLMIFQNCSPMNDGMEAIDPTQSILVEEGPQVDTDGDGLSDDYEQLIGTDPTMMDTDGDRIHDGAEIRSYNTSPVLMDTDGDNHDDGAEILAGTNPNNSESHPQPIDTDPNVYDRDNDGLTETEEIAAQTDPNRADTDSDGLLDGAEVNTHETDPNLADSDSDGLFDGAEVNTHGTDPLNPDTDNDSKTDGEEVVAGTDPLVIDGTYLQRSCVDVDPDWISTETCQSDGNLTQEKTVSCAYKNQQDQVILVQEEEESREQVCRKVLNISDATLSPYDLCGGDGLIPSSCKSNEVTNGTKLYLSSDTDRFFCYSDVSNINHQNTDVATQYTCELEAEATALPLTQF